ncbi:MAG: histidine--tRNA ligase, partial [Oscillospiraceae bacterium]
RAYYIMSCFRYEKPQAGRLREFHQLGIELFGADSPDTDCEVIRVANTIITELGIRNVRLEINSIGCPECRARYRKALMAFFENHKSELCGTCLERFERNPMRILDCKSPGCQAIAAAAPLMLDYLCGDCREHFSQVGMLLKTAGIAYEINPRIVRGLDYYTRTVFEFIHDAAGAQGTVCGGGRYDGLVELLGGSSVPAVGFGMGIERLLSVLDAEGVPIPEPEPPALFIAYLGDKGKAIARSLSFELVGAGVRALYDLCGRSLKAQLKYADKTGARMLLVIGDDEVECGEGRLKDMRDGTETPVSLDCVRLTAALSKLLG